MSPSNQHKTLRRGTFDRFATPKSYWPMVVWFGVSLLGLWWGSYLLAAIGGGGMLLSFLQVRRERARQQMRELLDLQGGWTDATLNREEWGGGAVTTLVMHTQPEREMWCDETGDFRDHELPLAVQACDAGAWGIAIRHAGNTAFLHMMERQAAQIPTKKSFGRPRF